MDYSHRPDFSHYLKKKQSDEVISHDPSDQLTLRILIRPINQLCYLQRKVYNHSVKTYYPVAKCSIIKATKFDGIDLH